MYYLAEGDNFSTTATLYFDTRATKACQESPNVTSTRMVLRFIILIKGVRWLY